MTPPDSETPDRAQGFGAGHWATFIYGIILGFGIALLALQFGLLGSH